jgi:uncharacterized protein YprB with RNaseH-like and TPR domain/predicted nuclease with RNAse H fold
MGLFQGSIHLWRGCGSVLRHSFLHIPGIGRRTERDLWEAGILSWEDYARPAPVGAALRRRLETYVPRSIEALRRKDAGFFARLSAWGEAWRLYPEFASESVFLDIETTGLSPVFDSVTVVGLFDGRRYEVFIEGQNLSALPEKLKRYSVAVTFNGSGFDLRFLKLAFENLALPPVHIDLRWVVRRLGYRGGLKAVEREFGIRRERAVAELDGYDATVLWSRYLRGDHGALRQLIAYNTEDVVHLKAIMEQAYDRLAKEVAGSWWRPKPLYEGVAGRPERRPQRRSLPRSSRPGNSVVARLLERCELADPKIVGIDLTGSERRATGWALLRASRAQTRSLLTDEEIIRETAAAQPDIVSIDSPLSVPVGWSPGQEQIADGSPIYRKCELALKRMGVSVYWCLLPSMRSLTMRGMRLAAQLRQRGLHVIESYPGAAQDILRIPRKGSSLEELKWGLKRAGLEGSFLTDRVTHDEVDAVTAALVGLFFLAGEYLALGTPEEDYLIVPRSPKTNAARLAEIVSRTGLDNPLV